MKILFCNITYLNKYIGITDDDMPNKGGAWVVENKDAHEQWNFLNYDGYCYGYVQNKGEKYSIERIDKSATKSDALEGVTIVWCALNDKGETVIVGWYENATVYRYWHKSIYTPIYGLERYYFTKAKAEDCYLLDEKYRTFTIGRASIDGAGKGFGQNNYWFAESSYAREELIPKVMEFIEANRKCRINRINKDFSEPDNIDEILTAYELKEADTLYYDDEFFKFLPLGYRLYHEAQNSDCAYFIATALAALHQYTAAIDWYKTVIEKEGKSWEVNSLLTYLYQQCERYNESIDSALDLLEFEEAKEEKVRTEIYGLLADDYHSLHKDDVAIEWLNKIINESTDNDLLKHTYEVKKLWSE